MPAPAVLPKCHCRCHQGSVGDRLRDEGVSYDNPLEAAVACSACQPYHAVALLSMRLANAPAPRIVQKGVWIDPDSRKKEKPDEPQAESQDDGN